ncbi:TetR/AcrR family transcriptional regulator [Kribbella sandramycini]|uniref:AcrR family transcriptional regulator n=1 Tax=Kribbella sandramycini TaxID=60450 RepID=A0A7Y4L0B9_9ACTN|nr:TetR/AcrR family transcriptional regulator [Kribbella sandramycini]MBB6565703.1 AcrR family transcriptional regulator [Kribbella sandramycini]NOL41965.1 TetR/AcrR family transcriptional regulator [Kribbella sandramycini]
MGRRERSKAALRQRLLAAALAAFVEKGYHAATIDEIAERADVARATAFNHFPRKEDFLVGLIVDRRVAVRELMARHLAEPGQSVIDAIRGVVRELGRWWDSNRSANQAMMRAVLHSGVMAVSGSYASGHIFGQAIADGQQRGEIRTDLDPIAVGNLIFDGYLGILYRWGLGEVDLPLDQAFDTILEIVVGDISPR